ncbi:hypothetical protein ACHAWC_011489 [Mediolabrus comicus]
MRLRYNLQVFVIRCSTSKPTFRDFQRRAVAHAVTHLMCLMTVAFVAISLVKVTEWIVEGDSDCPEVKGKNVQYALYALGIEVRRTIVDLVSYEPDEDGVATDEVVTVKRQECFTRNVPYEKDGTTGLIDSTEVECYQCLICQPHGGDVDSCGAYPADIPPLTDGCKDYSTDPASPTGPPELVRRLRA